MQRNQDMQLQEPLDIASIQARLAEIDCKIEAASKQLAKLEYQTAINDARINHIESALAKLPQILATEKKLAEIDKTLEETGQRVERLRSILCSQVQQQTPAARTARRPSAYRRHTIFNFININASDYQASVGLFNNHATAHNQTSTPASTPATKRKRGNI